MKSQDKLPSGAGVATAAAPVRLNRGSSSAAKLADRSRTLPLPIPSSARARETGALRPPPPIARGLDRALNILIRFFTSLRLTVVCLALALVLVFFGTMAQDPLGLYLAQEKFFRSFFVSAAPMWAAIKKALEMLHIYLRPSTAADVLYGSRLPVFPGGYLIGGVLLINLMASHFKRFAFKASKAGIWMVHAGLILLLLGQLGTDLLSRESTLHLREGEAKNYSETEREAELAVIDTTDAQADKVVAIPQGKLMSSKSIRHAELPFTLRIKEFFPNSSVSDRAADATGAPPANPGHRRPRDRAKTCRA